jgi:hypothetical protein
VPESADPPYHLRIARSALLLAALVALLLSACGGSDPKNPTLPPAPTRSGMVALRNLTHEPEVYADATLQTVGTVTRATVNHQRLYVLAGARGGVRVVLEPTASFARYLGRRVDVHGIFSATFAVGYVLLASSVRAAASL